MAEDKSVSIDEWLDQINNLDAYLANGGPLLELPISSLDMVPESIVERVVKRITHERLKQFGGFRERFEDRATPESDTGETAPEQQTADPPTDVASDKTRAA